MTRLNPDAREILDLADGLDDPTDADRNRHRARLIGSLGAAAGLTVSIPAGAAGTVLASGSIGAVAGGALAKSVLLFALLGGVAGGAVCAVGEMARPNPRASAVVTSDRPIARERSPEPAPAHTSASPPTLLVPDPPTAPTPPPLGEPARRQAREPALPAAQPQASSARTLQEEVDLIRRAHEALRAGDPSLALMYVGQHAARFPNGALTQERVAARVLAVCSLHRPGAVDEARAFLAVQPDSPLAARVRAACGL